MEQGRGSSFPGDKGVKKSGDIWIPSTPDKPVVQSSNNDQSEIQQNQMEGEDWYNLVGMYKDVLRNKQPLDFDLNSSGSLNCSEHNDEGVPLAESYSRLEQNLAPSGIAGLNSKVQLSQDVAPVEAYSGLPLNFDQNGFTGMNDLEHGIQNASILHKSRSLNQNAGREGSYVQNSGEVVSSQKVDSFAQLMSIMIARRSSLSDGSPESSTFFAAKPTIAHPISLVESSHVAHASVGERVQQNHIFHGSNQVAYARVGAGFPQSHVFYENHDVGRYNQQEIQNSEYNACKTGGERVQQNHIFHGSNPVANARVGAGFPQSHVFYESHDDGRYNQQEIQNSRLSMAEYNLNLTPRSESRESSSASRSSLLGPVTPDQQNQSKMHQIYQVPHFFIDDTSSTKKYMHGSGLSPSESGTLEKEQSVALANSVSTLTAGIATTPLDMSCSDGGNGGIDLNKTPLQKTPKRVKHRPKVVVEGKPKRSPKNSSTKRNTPGGTPPAKKQYVRKDGTKNSTPPMTDTLKVVEASDVGPVMKSCKRKLNFDLETGAENGAEKEGQVRRPRQAGHLEQNNECHKVSLDSSGPSTVVAGAGHHDTYDKERRQTSAAYNFVHSLKNIPLESLPVETTELLPASREHSLNAIAGSLNARTSSVLQSDREIRYNQVHHCSGGHPHVIFQAIPCEQNLGFRGHSSVQTTPQVLENLMDTTDKQGIKRAYKDTVIRSSKDIALMGPQVQFHEITEWKTGSEMCKKNTENKSQGTSFSMNSGLTTIKEGIRENESRRNKSILAQSSTEHQNGESRDSVSRRHMISVYPNDNSAKFVCDPYMKNTNIRHKYQQQYASSQLHEGSDTMLPKTSHYSVDTQITKSVTAVVDRIMESVSSRDPLPIPINGYVYSPLHVEVNKRTAGLETYKKATVVDKVLQQEPKNKRSYKNSSKKSAGNRVEKRNILSVDDITDGMKDLQITNSSKELVWKEQSALVPYIRDGAVVPYEKFDVKKKIPRPRVDLDPESNRMWNLLMGDEGGDSAETMDTNREKWWEEERKVFRGRVDSFIARMHLVQGDRRFSKWKGSVVDSVIGVFLTQNVSDHLSSSAFMSLAAKFPSKSTMAGDGNGGNPPVGNHEVRITYPDGTTFHQKMVLELVNEHSSVTLTEKAQHRTDNVLPEKKTSLMNNYSRRTEGDIISSQSSSESFVLHASEDVRSSSGSNSEAECGWNISKNVGQVSVSQQTKRIAALQQNELQMKGSSCPNKTNLIDHQQIDTSAYGQRSEWVGISKLPQHQISVPPFTDSWPSMSLGLQNWEEDGLAFLGSRSISTLTSKDSKGTGAQCMDDYRGQSAESAFMVSDDGRSKFQTSSINDAVLKGDLELQNDSVNESYNCNSEHSIKHMSEKHGAFHREDSLLKDTRRPSDAFSKQPTEPSDDRKPTETTSNTRKRKAAKEKAETFNWDTLRKQVLLKAGTTERSREAMDSLDYEALQNADVHDISDTIKERGMSNVLAERMKNFLNRLVEDHERIDLEWLRDVEPGKAKDYLLSIRGLGLKSVECVRLLTLHHLAFPVDTNVGRIAVRLGWVPLQPLPESLQLHLLELYPILESIQKYLWPRLCKLDQETLYELHYQMITFGKVFCTKRDPNCNACPMRAECRHFASAFASARLALPGLQERHIVASSPASVYANNSSDVIIKPMPLLPSEDTIEQGVRLSGDCEPVIEEPKTPEPPTELEERDIEDAFYEDPDEIPVIKLNIKEFTTNLQSLLEKQIEIGGDMSKALVALSPGLASIPTPKLKHASRLRTEHQVYELPDWHPLLKEMDRREPDDPSPYLLAIWTPGETADSIQAPESRCRSMEGGGMCGNETCFSCNSTREAQAQTVRGTILIPCRTAMRGSFPLNGTYFQVNEVFADHESSLNPIYVPRNYLWNLPRRTVFFGSSVSSIFKGLSTKDIQFCFWKGFVCVRGFDQKTRAPRPLKARLHFPASKMAKRNEDI